ncbi:hypothetical protein R3W88_001128 [Solanum pinnatisectum]|uniref:Uncharacterized protein n=1 Tax=Solanum pinnatisectum TaxID=50273 RepID=A0AAV9MI53_9SOLN|nr:hypothetical protein R3W88_001128 [Solanum pinnatisectum]
MYRYGPGERDTLLLIALTFLLSKAKGEYWSEVKTTLHNCGSQKEYYSGFSCYTPR